MTVCICVSGIKYRISCETDWRFPELKDYLCPEAENGCAPKNDCCPGDDRCPGAADCVDILVTSADIEKERTGNSEYTSEENLAGTAVLRKVAEDVMKRGRMLIHGACISLEGRGYLFTAPSGTGKTTHVRLWKKHLGNDAVIVNGDKPILELGSEILVHGTPWAGKEGYQTNMSVPLCAAVEIVQGGKNQIRPVGKSQAFAYLYQHSFLRDMTPEQTRVRMEAVRQLVARVPVYLLECDMSDRAFACSYMALTGKKAVDREPERQ